MMHNIPHDLHKINSYIFLTFILLFSSSYVYPQVSIKKYDEAVSLGTGCQAAFQLRINGKRNVAYPFDWVITPFHGLVSFITNEGEDYFHQDHLSVIEILPASEHTPSMLHVVDLRYDIHSIHDFLGPDMSNYESVKEKYDRRVQRFFKLLKSNKKVLFIRVQLFRDEAEQLDQLLQALYPQLKYTILAVCDDPSAQSDWGLKRVRNFYMQQVPGNWLGDSERWKEILSQFSIKSSKKTSLGEW